MPAIFARFCVHLIVAINPGPPNAYSSGRAVRTSSDRSERTACTCYMPGEMKSLPAYRSIPKLSEIFLSKFTKTLEIL